MKLALLALLCSGCITYSVATEDWSAKKFAAFSAINVGVPALAAIPQVPEFSASDGTPLAYPFRYVIWAGTFVMLDGIVALIYHCGEPGNCKE